MPSVANGWLTVVRSLLLIANGSPPSSDRAVIVDRLPATEKQPKPGYVLEVLEQGETLEVVSVPTSWVTLLPAVWGQTESSAVEAS